MESPETSVARGAARILALELDQQGLAEQVEREVQARAGTAPPGTYEPVAIAIASLVISAASLAWTVYNDIRQRRDRPPSDLIERRVRLQLAPPPDVTTAQRDAIVRAVVEEVLRQADGDGDGSEMSPDVAK